MANRGKKRLIITNILDFDRQSKHKQGCLVQKPHNKFQNGTFGICNAYNLYLFKEFINKPTKT